MLDALRLWFAHDPLTNLLLMFGGGGFVAACINWYLMWAGRRRIRVRVVSELYDIVEQPLMVVTLRFEVTNSGDRPTSLDPSVQVRAVTPKAEPAAFMLSVHEVDRLLPSHSPREFTASATVGAVYPFCWFKRFRFRVLRGRGAITRYRNAANEDISMGRYWREYLWFRWRGRTVDTA